MSSPETETKTADSLEAVRADSRAELDAMLEQIDGAIDVAAEKVESGVDGLLPDARPGNGSICLIKPFVVA